MKDDIDVISVAKETMIILDYIDKDVFPADGDRSHEHLFSILSQVIVKKVVGTKAHRLIGWAQCAICVLTNTSSDLFRDINSKHKV